MSISRNNASRASYSRMLMNFSEISMSHDNNATRVNPLSRLFMVMNICSIRNNATRASYSTTLIELIHIEDCWWRWTFNQFAGYKFQESLVMECLITYLPVGSTSAHRGSGHGPCDSADGNDEDAVVSDRQECCQRRCKCLHKGPDHC